MGIEKHNTISQNSFTANNNDGKSSSYATEPVDTIELNGRIVHIWKETSGKTYYWDGDRKVYFDMPVWQMKEQAKQDCVDFIENQKQDFISRAKYYYAKAASYFAQAEEYLNFSNLQKGIAKNKQNELETDYLSKYNTNTYKKISDGSDRNDAKELTLQMNTANSASRVAYGQVGVNDSSAMLYLRLANHSEFCAKYDNNLLSKFLSGQR